MKIKIGICTWAMAAACAWGGPMSVQVREGVLRNRASFLGTVTGTLAYGERVDVGQRQAGWCEVVGSPSGATGWLHESALTPKRLVVESGVDDARIAASGEEVALAGKGFNKEVEAEYKKQNATLDYAWVDRMLDYQIPQAQLIDFLRQGGLGR
ncbi:MAG: SH3 domain-containing protein [Kiritimatiellae bacterium]|jgi:hypothetical protein|nr:SH3 domain-containing protein [Kiritimatiellia bacterium]MDD4341374.1 SH3 domain-containing protein [Kiritimatiellia bacterium]MDY0149859.1 SH3 domain-containing protein [Kiritimatiellia bacterium]